MNYFVLIYDRSRQKVEALRQFAESDREAAEAFRMEAQRRAIREHLDQEIVLFQTESEEALRRTHGSYFLTERELVERLREAAAAS